MRTMTAISVNLDGNKTITLKYVKVVQQFTLAVQAQADTTSVGVGVTVDSRGITTPGSAALNAGTYTLTAPDSITVGGVAYNYNTYTIT